MTQKRGHAAQNPSPPIEPPPSPQRESPVWSKVSDVGLLSLVTACGYCVVYAYHWAHFLILGISADYIRVSTSELVGLAALSVAVISFTLAMTESLDNILRVTRTRRGLAVCLGIFCLAFSILGVCYAFASVQNGVDSEPTVLILSHPFYINLIRVMPTPIILVFGIVWCATSKNARLDERLEDYKHAPIMFVLVAIVLFAATVGEFTAFIARDWPVLLDGDYKGYVILTPVDDSYLLGEVDCSSRLLGMALIKEDEHTRIHWKTETVGPLKPQIETTFQPYSTTTPEPRASACPNPSASAAAPNHTRAP